MKEALLAGDERQEDDWFLDQDGEPLAKVD
jgi:hypothetical protein